MAVASLAFAGTTEAEANGEPRRRPHASAPASSAVAAKAQPRPVQRDKDDDADDEMFVTECVAGCDGKPPVTVYRHKRSETPQLPAPGPSPWRLVALNLWCHDYLGCRSYDVPPLRRYEITIRHEYSYR